MKLKLMAIFDQASRAFLPPFAVATEEIALRQFVKLPEEQPNHDLVRYADSYNLYVLGSFDNESGLISELEQRSLGSLQILMGKPLRDSINGVLKPSTEALRARVEGQGEVSDA